MVITLDRQEQRLIADFRYSPEMVHRMYQIPGSRFRSTDKTWILPKDIETLRLVRVHFPHARIDERIKEWETNFYAQSKLNLESMQNGSFTDSNWDGYGFKTEPYEHQIKALDLINQNNNFALCMEMGTGKTWCIVNLMQMIKNDDPDHDPFLVVAPLSVVNNWGQEINKHSHNLTYSLLTGSRYEREKALEEKADIYVINYEGLRILRDPLQEKKWGLLACDESQKIKNRTTQQSKICYSLGRNSDRRYILTGTMIVNNPLDAFGQFKYLDESILGHNYYGFQNRYAVMITNGRARFPVRFTNLKELADRIAPWSYRITKKECLDLPEKIYETRNINLNPGVMRIYKELGRELVAELNSGEKITAPIILTKLLRFSQLTAGFIKTETGEIKEVGSEKVSELKGILEETEGKVVVWTKFKRELQMVARMLDDSKYGYVTLSGESSAKERQESLKEFKEPHIKVFLGQIESGGLGINLVEADTCVYMSNSYSLGTRLQSEDRLHRIGQKNNVTYIDIIATGTIDEKVLRMIKSKKNMADIINRDASRETIENLINVKEEDLWIKTESH